MNDDQWKRYKEVWESYGVKFTYDDGTHKSTYEILKQMSQVYEGLSDDEKENDKMHESCGAESFKKKRIKRKMAKKSRRKNR